MLMKLPIVNIIAFLAIVTASAQFNENAPWMKDLNEQQLSSKSYRSPYSLYEISDAFNE